MARIDIFQNGSPNGTGRGHRGRHMSRRVATASCTHIQEYIFRTLFHIQYLFIYDLRATHWIRFDLYVSCVVEFIHSIFHGCFLRLFGWRCCCGCRRTRKMAMINSARTPREGFDGVSCEVLQRFLLNLEICMRAPICRWGEHAHKWTR